VVGMDAVRWIPSNGVHSNGVALTIVTMGNSVRTDDVTNNCVIVVVSRCPAVVHRWTLTQRRLVSSGLERRSGHTPRGHREIIRRVEIGLWRCVMIGVSVGMKWNMHLMIDTRYDDLPFYADETNYENSCRYEYRCEDYHYDRKLCIGDKQVITKY
jgi:hypothetical protein